MSTINHITPYISQQQQLQLQQHQSPHSNAGSNQRHPYQSSCEHKEIIHYQPNTNSVSVIKQDQLEMKSKNDSDQNSIQRHNKKETAGGFRNCKDCGCFISYGGIKSLKEPNLNFQADMSPMELYLYLLEDESKYSNYKFFQETGSKIDQEELRQLRKPLIDKIFAFSEKLQQSQFTIHIACAFLDLFLVKRLQLEKQLKQNESQSNFRTSNPGNLGHNQSLSVPVKRQMMELKAHMCILLASKFDELDDRIPLIREIQKLARYEFSYKECCDEEESILRALQWQLMVITPVHFLDSLIGMGLVFEDDRIKADENGKLSPLDDQIIRKIRRFAEYFTELSAKCWETQLYKPSIVAFCCALCSRMSNQVTPVFSDRLSQMTCIPYSQEIYDCFEKLYQQYDESYRLSKDLQFQSSLKRANKTSVLSTCERTPHCMVTSEANQQTTIRRSVLESNQNIMNDSFINNQKEASSNQQKELSTLQIEDDTNECDDSSKAFDQLPMIQLVTKNFTPMNQSTLPPSSRQSIANITLKKVKPLHQIIQTAMKDFNQTLSMQNQMKRKGENLKINKENHSVVDDQITSLKNPQNQQSYIVHSQKSSLQMPRSCRLSTIPICKNESYNLYQAGDSTNHCSNSSSMIPTQPKQNSQQEESIQEQLVKEPSQTLQLRNQSESNIHFHMKVSSLGIPKVSIVPKLSHKRSFNNSKTRRTSTCSNRNNNAITKAKVNDSVLNQQTSTIATLLNQNQRSIQPTKKRESKSRSIFGCKQSGNSTSGSSSIQITNNNSNSQKIEEIKTKYQSENTIYEKGVSIVGRNNMTNSNSLLGCLQVVSNKTHGSTTKLQYYGDRSASESGSISELTKEKPIQFQTIQDQQNRKNTIVVEEESDGDKSQVEVANNSGETSSQMQSVDEFQDENAVVKAPISSKKSKSLENMNKILNKSKKNMTEKAIIELYKRQYLQNQNDQKVQKPKQVTTIDLTKLNKNEAIQIKPLPSQRQKTNFIKKNINIVTSMNSQLQQSADNQNLPETFRVVQLPSSDSKEMLPKKILQRGPHIASVNLENQSSSKQNLIQSQQFQNQQNSTSHKRFIKYNKMVNSSSTSGNSNSNQMQAKSLAGNKSVTALLPSQHQNQHHNLPQINLYTSDDVLDKTFDVMNSIENVQNANLTNSSSQRYLNDVTVTGRPLQKLLNPEAKYFLTAFSKNFKEGKLSNQHQNQNSTSIIQINIIENEITGHRNSNSNSNFNSKICNQHLMVPQSNNLKDQRRESQQINTNDLNDLNRYYPLSSRVNRSNNNSINQSTKNSCVKFQKFQARKPIKKPDQNISNQNNQSTRNKKSPQTNSMVQPLNSHQNLLENNTTLHDWNTQASIDDHCSVTTHNSSQPFLLMHKNLLPPTSLSRDKNSTSIANLNQSNSRLAIAKNCSQLNMSNSHCEQLVQNTKSQAAMTSTHQSAHSHLKTISARLSCQRMTEKHAKELIIKEEDEFRKVVGVFYRKKSNMINKNK